MSPLNLWMTSVAELSAGLLSIRFIKSGDRLAHCIGLQKSSEGSGGFLPVLESVEGDAQEVWPASPPMQQIVQEHIGHNSAPVLLGVGLSGNGHWSSAVEETSMGSLKLDIACKSSKPASYLGSQYRMANETEVDFKNNQVRLTVKRESNESVTLVLSAEIGKVAMAKENRLISIMPGSEASLIQTHRWCYNVAISPVNAQ
jgi:hypothetical protein